MIACDKMVKIFDCSVSWALFVESMELRDSIEGRGGCKNGAVLFTADLQVLFSTSGSCSSLRRAKRMDLQNSYRSLSSLTKKLK